MLSHLVPSGLFGSGRSRYWLVPVPHRAVSDLTASFRSLPPSWYDIARSPKCKAYPDARSRGRIGL